LRAVEASAGPRLAVAGLSAAAALAVAAPAAGQVSASVSIDSDFRLRGLSMSDRKPAISLALAYDHPSGFYVGGQAIAAPFGDETRMVGYVEYAGYAWRAKGLSWDLGVDNQNLSLYYGGRYRWDYSDVYAGVSGRNLGVHVYYSPNYLTHDTSAGYLSVDGAFRPADNWRVFGHLGAFTPLHKGPDAAWLRDSYDARIGVARVFSHAEVRLSAVGATPSFRPDPALTRPGVVIGLSIF
jgi:uncharacterized protein (TIGR02001 family)